jgi:pyrroline-5-carboxylate reductase
MTLGFVGVGEIVSHVVRALFTGPNPPAEVLLSPRSTHRSSALAQSFPGARVCSSNQEVVDGSDIVFIGVLPGQAEEVVKDLKFRSDQTVVSLAARIYPEVVAQWVAPASRVCQLIPLPFISLHVGPLVTYPNLPEVSELFDGIGELVSVETGDQLRVLSCASAMMSSFFAFTNTGVDWAIENGLDGDVAMKYMYSLMKANAHEGLLTALADRHELVPGHETPGGLNEYNRTTLEQAGMFELLDSSLTKLFTK